MKNIRIFLKSHKILSATVLILVFIIVFAHVSFVRDYTINRFTKETTGLSIYAFDDLLFPEKENNRKDGVKLDPMIIERYINNVRKSNSLPLLNHDADLTNSSAAKLANMVSDKYFGHTSPSGTQPWDFVSAAGYNYDYVGENLATGNFANEDDVVHAWMKSPAHKAILLDKRFCDIGISTDWQEFYDDRFDADIIVMHVGTRSYSTLFGRCQDL